MDKGNIVKWHVKEGTEVKAGDALADIETDKATLIFENQDEGFIAKLLMPDGSKDIPVGTPVAIVVEDKSLVPSFANFALSSSSKTPPSATPAPPPSGESRPAHHHRTPMISFPPRMTLDGLRISDQASNPRAPTKLSPQATQSPATPLQPPTAPKVSIPSVSVKSSPTYIDTPNSQIRKVIASRLLESKVTIPALYFTTEVKLDEASKFRASLLEQGIKVRHQLGNPTCTSSDSNYCVTDSCGAHPLRSHSTTLC